MLIPPTDTHESFEGNCVAQPILGTVFEGGSESVPSCFVEIQALIAGDLRRRSEITESHQGVMLIASTLLTLARGPDVIGEPAVSFTAEKVIDPALVDGPVIEEDPYCHHGLDHGCIPIAIGSRIKVLDDRVENLAQHFCETLSISQTPLSITVRDQFRCVHEVNSGNANQKAGIVTLDPFQGSSVVIQNLDSLVGVSLGSAQRPVESVGVGRYRIVHQLSHSCAAFSPPAANNIRMSP